VRAYDGPHTLLRPRAVFGPGDTVVFPRILRAAKEGRFPLIESDETVMADLITIDSLVDYIVRVIERRAEGLFHLSNDHPVPVIAFLTELFAQLGLPAPRRRIAAARAMRAAACIEAVYRALPFLGEPPITRFGVSVFAYSKTMDVTKCLRELGPPKVALADGVSRFVAWQKAQA
jgi:2-alkyl-3-oxoalkanoate reductase